MSAKLVKGKTMGDSRTRNSTRNAVVSISFYVVYTIMSFVLRKIFIVTLGNDYLSISGLFTNILTVLSFAELGIGEAIIFNLYKPIAFGDTEKIKSLMALYKKAYMIIGTVIFGVGVALIPFLGYLISDEAPDIRESITLLYVLYLFNTSVSYFFSFKQAIITANQKNYIVSAFTNTFRIAQMVFQGIFLFLTHNFLAYLLIQISFTVINNVTIAYKADKVFPYLKDKNVKPVEKGERKSIFKNVKALMLYKVGSTLLNGTDNIIITKVIALSSVGLVSNFNMIVVAVSAVIDQIPKAVVASVGNLNATGDREKKYRIFKVLLFMCSWIYGFCASGIYFFANDFVSLAFGSEWVLDPIVIFSIVLQFYVSSVHSPCYTYRTTLGYFVQGRWTPLIASVINISLSIILGKIMGLAGVFFATSIARVCAYGIVDSHLIYKNCFEKKQILYFLRYGVYFGAAFLIAMLSGWIISFIPFGGIVGFIIKLAVYCVVYNAAALAVSFKTPEFKYLKKAFTQNVLKKLLHKSAKENV